MNNASPVLTIDGPSGAGKGTVSRTIAKQLGWHYLDSGAIYRALAIDSLDNQISLDDQSRITELAHELDLSFDCGDEFRVLLKNQNINHRIANESTGNAASKIAAYPSVRTALLERQQAFQQAPGLVADGRDMGTVVFPHAQYKVFLTASASVRAQRRYKQLKEKGISANLSQLTLELEERDRRDLERSSAPLRQAEGALLIDSSDLPIDAVIKQVIQLIQKSV